MAPAARPPINLPDFLGPAGKVLARQEPVRVTGNAVSGLLNS